MDTKEQAKSELAEAAEEDEPEDDMRAAYRQARARAEAADFYWRRLRVLEAEALKAQAPHSPPSEACLVAARAWKEAADRAVAGEKAGRRGFSRLCWTVETLSARGFWGRVKWLATGR